MVAAVKWESALVDEGGIDTGATLADNTVSAASVEIAGQTNLDTIGYYELSTSDHTALFSVSPDDASPTVDLYITRAVDATNYESVPVTGGADQSNQFIGSFPVMKNTTQHTVVIGPLSIPPCKFKFYVDNQSGQTLTAEWEVTLWSNNLESQ